MSFPAVRVSLAACGRTSRRWNLPAEVMVYFVLALGLFRSVSPREVLRWLETGSLRLEPFRELHRHCVRARVTYRVPRLQACQADPARVRQRYG